MHPLVTQQHIDDYARDGAVLVRGLLAGFVEEIAAGIEMNMSDPGPYAAENLKPGETGRFFDDYCNWTRIPPFDAVIRRSSAAEVAADLMGSDSAQLFHDHVLVKEPGTSKATPWHQDSPYYFVEGQQTLSFWCRSILSVQQAFAAWQDRISGRGRYCRPAGCLKRISMPTRKPICRSPTPMPRGCGFSNGRWNPATRLRSISACCTGRVAMKAISVAAPSRCGWLATTRAMSSGRDAHLRLSRGTGCDPVIACGRTGSRLFSDGPMT